MNKSVEMIGGLRIIAHPYVAEFGGDRMALEDFAERLHASTMHHIDLSLIPLSEPERYVITDDKGTVWMHPNTLAILKLHITTANEEPE